jgi:predicted N-acyltransferase
MPLYLKHHSMGEFVFDWAWAEAHQRAGLAYYPKLLVAIPFSPVTGPRLLSGDDAVARQLVQAARDLAGELGLSSLHYLFPDAGSERALAGAGLMRRAGVQFHWRNPGYASFEDYLATLTRDKRKKMRQDRRRVRDAGVSIACKSGADIAEADWRFFYRCYQHTYRERGREPYLNADFFLRLGEAMPEHCLLVIAEREGRPIAAALDLFNADTMWGRYWGALEYVPGLHFEVCYHQGQEFCIARGIRLFEGGAQGEHKHARGFEATPTCSYHWLADARLSRLVADFVAREARGVAAYVDEMDEHSAYKQDEKIVIPAQAGIQ